MTGGQTMAKHSVRIDYLVASFCAVIAITVGNDADARSARRFIGAGSPVVAEAVCLAGCYLTCASPGVSPRGGDAVTVSSDGNPYHGLSIRLTRNAIAYWQAVLPFNESCLIANAGISRIDDGAVHNPYYAATGKGYLCSNGKNACYFTTFHGTGSVPAAAAADLYSPRGGDVWPSLYMIWTDAFQGARPQNLYVVSVFDSLSTNAAPVGAGLVGTRVRRLLGGGTTTGNP